MPVAAESSPTPSAKATAWVVLTGNPNCGKTTLFNALTGLRAKVGNYAGVTVERKEGALRGAPADLPVVVLDLPGTYSLSPKSIDEQISRDVLFHRLKEVPAPSLVVVVIDASNLERNLYYATQVIELGHATMVALNMIDVAEENGHVIDVGRLARELGVPVLPVVGNTGRGVPELRQAMVKELRRSGTLETPKVFAALPVPMETELGPLGSELAGRALRSAPAPSAEALLALTDETVLEGAGYPDGFRERVVAARQRMEAAGVDWRSAVIEARYARVGAIHRMTVTEAASPGETMSDRLDRVLTHKVWGLLIFVAVMAVMFQSIFSFAQYPMEWLQDGVGWAGEWVGRAIPPGALHSLLVDGVIAGVGAVVVFLPQILLLFFFIGLLEDTGYMARAAFLMDRLMSRLGLHGKSFIPMLSSFACAIPGIMATRTIESPKDRLVTILVAPLMSCSARLPVYTVLIAACLPEGRVLGFMKTSGLTMLAMYMLGIVMALLMAWIFKRTLLRGEPPMLIMELPPYKRPVLLVVLRHMWDRSRLFLRRAGTVILGISILLWFLATYPKDPQAAREFAARRAAVASMAFPAATTPAAVDEARTARSKELDREESGERMRHSFAGRLGRLIEPTIAPLGFDWKIGIGIVSSFAAREVFVSTMSTVYNVGEYDRSDEAAQGVAGVLRAQRRADGSPVYTVRVGIALMVFYVFALQCVSTVAVVRRETNSWKWPVFQWVYMGVLAWVMAFLAYHGAGWLGYP